jgi:hypothetical protein
VAANYRVSKHSGPRLLRDDSLWLSRCERAAFVCKYKTGDDVALEAILTGIEQVNTIGAA